MEIGGRNKGGRAAPSLKDTLRLLGITLVPADEVNEAPSSEHPLDGRAALVLIELDDDDDDDDDGFKGVILASMIVCLKD